ncbi:Zinc finger MYM-type protein 1 [Acipenser ruthenus]|uniref:Zinc finger MYM-type protein 1 n=1 Tax=Acipenser ruthenus TaxID=7906 RepID=A0A662YTL1_ACIRT|nr:Zinc finger MYM-type protein 1 [Acipenser ruthenus]
MVQAYPKFSKTSLCIDLQTVYETEDLKNVENALSMLELMIYNNLDRTFQEMSKLLKIVITTPITTAESERCFSTLKRIKTFLRNSMKTEQLNALAMLSIEKDMMADIPDFNNKVIEKFATIRHRRANFLYRFQRETDSDSASATEVGPLGTTPPDLTPPPAKMLATSLHWSTS